MCGLEWIFVAGGPSFCQCWIIFVNFWVAACRAFKGVVGCCADALAHSQLVGAGCQFLGGRIIFRGTRGDAVSTQDMPTAGGRTRAGGDIDHSQQYR